MGHDKCHTVAKTMMQRGTIFVFSYLLNLSYNIVKRILMNLSIYSFLCLITFYMIVLVLLSPYEVCL